MASEQFSLCWDNFHKNMSSGMNSLLENEDLVDVTLAVQGKSLKAHKMVLSVCSPYFKELFKSNPCEHPIVFMKDVSYEALSDLLQFMYQGEVQVSQENLSTFIKTAEALQIKGLTGDGNGSTDNDVTEVPVEKHTPQVEEYKPIPVPRPKKQQLSSALPASSPSIKRQRLSLNESQSISQTITKVEPAASSQPINVPTPESAVHFKMEPYDQTQNLLDDTGDDNFGDDTLDETVGDDTEDYSMMETGTGGTEEEPQAGTSTDGAGEGQDLLYKTTACDELIIIHDGYIFRQEIRKKWIGKFFWMCVNSKITGCRFKFRLLDNRLEILKSLKHNHYPTFRGNLEECSVEIVNVHYVNKYSRISPSLCIKSHPAQMLTMFNKPAAQDLLSYLNLQLVSDGSFSDKNTDDTQTSRNKGKIEICNSVSDQIKNDSSFKITNCHTVMDKLNENDVDFSKNKNDAKFQNTEKNGFADIEIKQEVVDLNEFQIKKEPDDSDYSSEVGNAFF